MLKTGVRVYDRDPSPGISRCVHNQDGWLQCKTEVQNYKALKL